MSPFPWVADLKILELAGVLAGPLAGSFFAELGAEVIKIENKTLGGDVTRQWKLPAEPRDSSPGAYYSSANYGKKVVFLDFNEPADHSSLQEYISNSDVIITNFQKKVAEKFRLSPEELHRLYPDKIIIQLNAFTYEDPRPGYDLIMQAESGYISITGTEDGVLCKIPVAMMDILASHQIREALLLAMLKRQKTGHGSLAHVSLYQSAISGLVNQAGNFLMANSVGKPLGTLHPNIAPYGDLFESKDKIRFLLGVGSDEQFKKLWKTLNFLAPIPINFVTNSNRLTHRRALQDELQKIFSQKNFNEWEKDLEETNIPFARIKNIQEVFDDPLSIDMIRERSSEEGDKLLSVSQIAFRFSE